MNENNPVSYICPGSEVIKLFSFSTQGEYEIYHAN